MCLFRPFTSMFYHICQVIPFFSGPHTGANSTTLSCLECCHSHNLHNYHTQTGLLLSAIGVPHEVLRCTNSNCNDEAHRTLQCKLYNDIIKSLKDVAEVIPTKANNTSSKHTVLHGTTWSETFTKLLENLSHLAIC